LREEIRSDEMREPLPSASDTASDSSKALDGDQLAADVLGDTFLLALLVLTYGILQEICCSVDKPIWVKLFSGLTDHHESKLVREVGAERDIQGFNLVSGFCKLVRLLEEDVDTAATGAGVCGFDAFNHVHGANSCEDFFCPLQQDGAVRVPP
jgi:hypothetical protein